ncbi:hypothetical protein J6590_051195 [Homalodisca vitripennis]|nr:hypothetical protein J6590_051195 [Homalodisca vitripennis]
MSSMSMKKAMVSPRDILPVPKNKKRLTNKGPKPAKAAVITSSPYKLNLEEAKRKSEEKEGDKQRKVKIREEKEADKKRKMEESNAVLGRKKVIKQEQGDHGKMKQGSKTQTVKRKLNLEPCTVNSEEGSIDSGESVLDLDYINVTHDTSSEHGKEETPAFIQYETTGEEETPSFEDNLTLEDNYNDYDSNSYGGAGTPSFEDNLPFDYTSDEENICCQQANAYLEIKESLKNDIEDYKTI